MASLPAQLMNKTTKKQTELTKRWMMLWILVDGIKGAFLRVLHYHSNHAHFREAREQVEMIKLRAERPKITQQFSDLKRKLSTVTDEEWEGIPEVGNLSRKKRRREERSYVVPDSILVGGREQTEFENSLDQRQQQVSRYNPQRAYHL
jgi:hypothetical protein